MPKQNRIIIGVAGAVFVVIVILETVAPANIVGAYALVLPILLVATLRSRPLMLLTVIACIAATYLGLMQPTKPGRFQAAVINRTLVAGVLGGSPILTLFVAMQLTGRIRWSERLAPGAAPASAST